MSTTGRCVTGPCSARSTTATAAACAGGNPTFLVNIETPPENLDVNIHPTKQEVKFIDERFLYDFVSEAVRKTLGIEKSEAIPAQRLRLRGFAPDRA